MMNRRDVLQGFIAAGAVMTAEGFWLPGQKLISIPKCHLILKCDEISLVTSKGIVVSTTKRSDVRICDNRADLYFSEICRDTIDPITDLYVGRTHIAQIDNPMRAAMGMCLDVKVESLDAVLVKQTLGIVL